MFKTKAKNYRKNNLYQIKYEDDSKVTVTQKEHSKTYSQGILVSQRLLSIKKWTGSYGCMEETTINFDSHKGLGLDRTGDN